MRQKTGERLNAHRAFKLVEIVVVITIIFVLAAVVLTSVSQARANTRDKSRVTDLNAIALAMQLERELNGSYPSGSGEITSASSYNTIVATHIGRSIIDPNGTSGSYGYFYSATLCGGRPGVYVQAFETGFDEVGDCDGTYPYTIQLP